VNRSAPRMSGRLKSSGKSWRYRYGGCQAGKRHGRFGELSQEAQNHDKNNCKETVSGGQFDGDYWAIKIHGIRGTNDLGRWGEQPNVTWSVKEKVASSSGGLLTMMKPQKVRVSKGKPSKCRAPWGLYGPGKKREAHEPFPRAE